MTRFASLLCAAAAALVLSACQLPPYDGTPPPGYYGPEGNYGPREYDGTQGYYGAGDYDDPCLTDKTYCSYAYFQGPIWWNGAWYSGPHRWRDTSSGREFWVHGAWRRGVQVGQAGYWGEPARSRAN
jgi:hypothetical protein